MAQPRRASSLLLVLLVAGCGAVGEAVDGLSGVTGGGGDPPVVEVGETFIDDFDPPEDEWFLGRDGPFAYRAEDGAYVVEGGPDHSGLLSPRTYPADAEVVVATAFRVIEQPVDRGGILAVACHLIEGPVDDNGFGAVVQVADGELSYALLEWVDDGLEPLVPVDDPAPGFDPDGVTTLELRCRPSPGSMHLELAVDGEIVASADAQLRQTPQEHVRGGLYVDTSPLEDEERLLVRFERFGMEVSGAR